MTTDHSLATGAHGSGASRTLHAAIGQIAVARGVSYTLHEILDHLEMPNVKKRLWCVSTQREFHRDYHQAVFGATLWRALCKIGVPDDWQQSVVYRRAARAVRPGDIMYVWPPYNTDLIRGAKDRGAIVIAERINCMARACKEVLDPAFARLGRVLPEGWCVPSDMAIEDEQMRQCDFVTAPNAFVARSLRMTGIPDQRILETSYGWSPARLRGAVGVERPQRRPVFLFVGLGIVRKGLDLLLDYWSTAQVDGELHIAGRIDDDIRARCAPALARTDVKELGYVGNMAQAYAQADVFVFPSHEEGGPQVTYEAAGCGLPCLVSPMGAGRIVRHATEGYVVDSFDADGWIEALRTLAGDGSLRRRLGTAAAQRALDFTWERVGERSSELLRTRVLTQATTDPARRDAHASQAAQS
jgi:glycosyltransferase involved in cell wall biosynthesis